jgi:cellulose synthase operon protein C
MWVALLVAASGLAASVPLIPSDREIAFLSFKDQRYDSARAELERQLAEGDLSVTVVKPLAELYLQYADVDSAILLLERFVAEHPDDLAARRVLGTYYQFGQRPYDYLVNLEQVARRAPTTETLRELAEIYSWMDEPDKQIEVLSTLESSGRATTAELAALARLRATRGQYDEAVSALERADRGSAGTLDHDGVELLAALLIDAGRADSALPRLAARADVTADLALAVRLARTFHGKGHPQLAARLLATSPALDPRDPSALAALTQAEVDAGLADRALSRLGELRRQGSLPEPLRPTLFELAVFGGDLDTAWAIGRDAGWPGMPPRAVAGLIAAVHAQGRTADAQALLREAGDRGLDDVPVLAAQLAADRGDLAAVRRWIGVADERPPIHADDQVALAALERRLGSAGAAYGRLRRHLLAGGATPWAVESFAQLALDTSRAADAAPLLLRQRAPLGAPAEAAWARVATAAGDTEAVRAWLRSPAARQVPVQALRDVAYLALDTRRAPLALEAARLLPSAGATRADRLLLGRALSENAQLDAALDVLRPLAADDVAARALFDATLSRASARDAKARAELVRRMTAELALSATTAVRRAEIARSLIAAGAWSPALEAMAPLVRADADGWLAAYVEASKHARSDRAPVALLTGELRRTDLAVPAREALVRALVEIGESRAAEPFMRDLADDGCDAWAYVYDEALAARGARAARTEWWRSRGLRDNLPVADRRAAAFKLTDLRDKAGAQQVLLALADDEPADGASLSQLLHLWGPRPHGAALQWLESRARSARGPDQARWVQHLTDVGASARAIAVLGSTPQVGDLARFDAWVNALRAARDKVRLRQALETAADATHDPRRLDALARVALAESIAPAAERAFLALVAVEPDALEARKWLGLISLARNDYVAAREHFESYVAAGGREPEALLHHGELLERGGRHEAAQRAFALGLRESERVERRTVAARRVHAFLLAHAGRQEDARRDLEALVTEQPADAHLRADYAAWLLKEGRRADAGRILAVR